MIATNYISFMVEEVKHHITYKFNNLYDGGRWNRRIHNSTLWNDEFIPMIRSAMGTTNYNLLTPVIPNASSYNDMTGQTSLYGTEKFL